MDERGTILKELLEVEQTLKELSVLYEQYFAGVEKREPVKVREAVAGRLRRFINRRIIQTDLRFRYQTLAARYHSYAAYWDRILRLIDEGRYVRQTARLAQGRSAKPEAGEPPGPSAADAVERLYQELLAARDACRLAGTPPEKQQIARFLESQKEKVREKFGDREVEFRVVTEDGKPKIKVRAKP